MVRFVMCAQVSLCSLWWAKCHTHISSCWTHNIYEKWCKHSFYVLSMMRNGMSAQVFCAHYRGVQATRSGGQSSSACSPYGHFWTGASRCFLSSQLELTAFRSVFFSDSKYVEHQFEWIWQNGHYRSQGGGASKNSTMDAQCAPVSIFVQYPHNDLHFQEITLKPSVKELIDISQFWVLAFSCEKVSSLTDKAIKQQFSSLHTIGHETRKIQRSQENSSEILLYSKEYALLFDTDKKVWSWIKRLAVLLQRWQEPFTNLYCVTRAPVLNFIRSWVALSFKVVSQSVSQSGIGNTCPDLHFLRYIKAWVSSTDPV